MAVKIPAVCDKCIGKNGPCTVYGDTQECFKIPPKKKPDTSFMMSDGTGIEVIDDELFCHDSDGNLRSYPPPNILQRFVTWIRSMLSSDLSRTSEGWFMAGKPKHKSKRRPSKNMIRFPIMIILAAIIGIGYITPFAIMLVSQNIYAAITVFLGTFIFHALCLDIAEMTAEPTEQMATRGELFEGYEDEITASEDELHQIKLAWDAMEAAHRPLVLLPCDFKPHHKELEQLNKDNAQARYNAIKEHSETMEQLQKDYSRRRYNLERERGTDHTKG